MEPACNTSSGQHADRQGRVRFQTTAASLMHFVYLFTYLSVLACNVLLTSKGSASSELNWSDLLKRMHHHQPPPPPDDRSCIVQVAQGENERQKKKIDGAFEEKPQRPLKLAQLNEWPTVEQNCVDSLREPRSAQDAEGFLHCRPLMCLHLKFRKTSFTSEALRWSDWLTDSLGHWLFSLARVNCDTSGNFMTALPKRQFGALWRQTDRKKWQDGGKRRSSTFSPKCSVASFLFPSSPDHVGHLLFLYLLQKLLHIYPPPPFKRMAQRFTGKEEREP